MVDREPRHLLALLAHLRQLARRGQRGEADVPVGAAGPEASAQLVAVEVEKTGDQREIGETCLFPRFAQRGRRDGCVVRLDVASGLNSEPALAVEAEQRLLQVRREDEAAGGDVHRAVLTAEAVTSAAAAEEAQVFLA